MANQAWVLAQLCWRHDYRHCDLGLHIFTAMPFLPPGAYTKPSFPKLLLLGLLSQSREKSQLGDFLWSGEEKRCELEREGPKEPKPMTDPGSSNPELREREVRSEALESSEQMQSYRIGGSLASTQVRWALWSYATTASLVNINVGFQVKELDSEEI